MTQTIVVTGAGGGIGRAAAVRFARRGAAVAVLARDEQGLQRAVDDVRRAGGTAFPVPADMASEDAVFAAADYIEDDLGPIDIWVNAALGPLPAAFRTVPPAHYRRATEVTYLGFVWGTLAALRHMTARNRGTIVQATSALAYRGFPRHTVSCGAEHAIKGFTDALRCELMHEHSKIRLTAVALPVLDVSQPERAAQAIAVAADHPRRRVHRVDRHERALFAAVAGWR